MPDLNLIDVYSVNKKNIQGLMVVVQPTSEMLAEDMKGVSVDFAMPNGQVMEATVDRYFGFEGNFHLFFPRITKAFKPVGFSDPDETKTISFDTDSIA